MKLKHRQLQTEVLHREVFTVDASTIIVHVSMIADMLAAMQAYK
jgi:hypothetical protein